MSPLSLVTHGASQNAHHRLLGGPPMGQMSNLTHEIEQRMIEYIKLLQNPKEVPRTYFAFISLSPPPQYLYSGQVKYIKPLYF